MAESFACKIRTGPFMIAIRAGTPGDLTEIRGPATTLLDAFNLREFYEGEEHGVPITLVSYQRLPAQA